MDAIFNQRGPRPVNQTFYFQLIPTLLTINNLALAKNLKAASSQFRLKIIKGTQLSDEMKKAIAVKAVNGKAAFDKVQLNFNLPSFNPNRNIEFILILLKSQEGEEQTEAGRYSLMSNKYIMDLKQNQTKLHREKIDIGEDYSLSFELYVDNSRFALEKLIKDARQQQKQGKRQDLLNINTLSINNNPTLNQAKSEVLTDKQKVEVVIPGEERFMSPTRKIVRKQSDGSKKLVRRASSPEKSDDGGSSAKRGLKFLGRSSQKQEDDVVTVKKQTFAEEESRKVAEKRKQEEIKRKQVEEEKKQNQKVQKQAEDKKKLQAQKAQERRIQAEKRKAEAEQKKVQAQRKRESDEASKKAQEARSAAQQKRLLSQKKKEEQQAARIAEQKKQQAQRRRQQQKKSQQAKRQEAIQQKQQNEANRAAQQQKIKLEIERQAQQEQRRRKTEQSKKGKQVRNQQRSALTESVPQKVSISAKRRQYTEISKSNKSETNQLQSQVSSSILNDSGLPELNISRNDSMAVRVKSGRKIQQDRTYNISAVESKDNGWDKPIAFKKTGSDLFDSSGHKIKESVLLKKKKMSDAQWKQRIYIYVFLGVAFMLMINAMSPSHKY